ncbi:hypothetical protein J5X98_01605 [Leptothermofonsia sichuanensis E412]|uniref:hypothetical protein n=1 Tax=Leptothermofonsia sichuanensis TaxID=2917832 RepID=UPI001CA6C220|nr:hypothetical protein [Leptothermofonsia sichuanensis]QZZ21224.1 hypothetical protein J5X98_01605 [Leptothermofonsia sichuanensis E412]
MIPPIIALYETEELELAKQNVLDSSLLSYLEKEKEEYDIELFKEEFEDSESYEDLSKESLKILAMTFIFPFVESMFYNQGDDPPEIEKLFEITLRQFQNL